MRYFTVLLLMFLALLKQAQVTSTFDADGWTCTDNGSSTSLTMNYNSTGDNPAASIY